MPSIIEDSRNKIGHHRLKNEYWEAEEVGVFRCALAVGDYARPPRVSVDTKADIYELAMDIDQEHERFRNEMIRAREMGTLLVILVENGDGVTDLPGLAAWSEPDAHFAARRQKSKGKVKRRVDGSRLAKACATMQSRYGCRFEFCAPEEAGRRVLELLDGEGGPYDHPEEEAPR